MTSLGEIQASLKLDGLGKFSTDLKTADKAMASFGKKTTEVGKSITKFGTNMTKFATLPILAAGVAITKTVKDYEVASRKFSKAFSGVEEAAGNSVDALKEMGVASSEATSLLANTGDILKGFGATSKEALGLSTEVQKLSVALSAYNGVPVAQASKATTAALLGETEQWKQMGIVVRQSDVEARLALKGQKDLTGQALLLAKAQATLELGIEQSSDAIGSLAENQETLAFQMSAAIADTKDLAVELGQILLPYVKVLVAQIREAVAWFSELSEAQKTTILTLAAITAAIGPVITSIGLATQAVGGLSTALAFLAANPIVLAIAGVAAVTAGVVALGKKVHRDNIEALSEEFGELAEKTGVAEDEMEKFLEVSQMVEGAFIRGQWNSTLEDTAGWVKELSANLGLTEEQIIGIGLASEELSDNFKDQLTELEKQRSMYDVIDELNDVDLVRQEQRTQHLESQAKRSEERASAEIIATGELEKQLAISKGIEAAAQDQLTMARNIIDGKKTELELLDEQIAKLEFDRKGNSVYQEIRLKALQILHDKRMKLLDEYADAEKKVADKQKSDAMASAQSGYNNVLAIIAKIGKYRSRQEKKRIDNWKKWTSAAGEAMNSVEGLMDISSENWADALDASADQFMDAAMKSGNAYVMAAAIVVKTVTKILKVWQDIKKAAEAHAKNIAAVESEIAAIRLAERKKSIEAEYDLEMENIDKVEAAKIAAYVATLSQKEQEALRSAGIIEETELQRIEREKKAAIKAGDAEALALLKREKEIETIRAAAEAERLQAEKEYKNKLSQYEYDKAVSDKNAKLIEIEAAHQEALAGLKWWQWLAGWDDDVNDVYSKLYSTVSSLSIPAPVMLAQGGIIPQTPGGVNTIIGEGAADEAVLPLTPETFQALGSAIVQSQQGTVTTGDTMMNSSLTVVLEGLGQTTIPITQEALNNKQIRVPSSTLVQGI